MVSILGRPWSAEEDACLHQKWLIELWEDDAIAVYLTNTLSSPRTTKAVKGRREDIGLLFKNHPQRPLVKKPALGRRTYTEQDGIDILRRYESGEQRSKIAKDYGVSSDALKNKLDDLLQKKLDPEKVIPESTPRLCLTCGKHFMSIIPKAYNRRCSPCDDVIRETGSSLTTTYPTSPELSGFRNYS